MYLIALSASRYRDYRLSSKVMPVTVHRGNESNNINALLKYQKSFTITVYNKKKVMTFHFVY